MLILEETSLIDNHEFDATMVAAISMDVDEIFFYSEYFSHNQCKKKVKICVFWLKVDAMTLDYFS